MCELCSTRRRSPQPLHVLGMCRFCTVTPSISHNNKKLKFFCCQFTIDHNEALLLKATRDSSVVAPWAKEWTPINQAARTKKEIFKQCRFCLGEERRQQSGDGTRREARGKFLMRMEERENNSQRGPHGDGGDSAFKDLLLT